MMEADEEKHLSVLAGLRALPRGSLRFCSHCVEEDRRQFGECYWHRVHQIPGGEVCPSHSTFLQTSSVPIHNQRNPYEYVSLEKVVDRRLYLLTGETSVSRHALLKIAQDALWLLQNHTLATSLSSIQSHYFFLLAERGLVTRTGNVDTSKLLEAFQQYHPEDFLKHIHCEITESTYDNWVTRISYRATKNLYSPLRHLLFIHFLEQTIETFLNSSTEKRPLQKTPCDGSAQPAQEIEAAERATHRRLWLSTREGNPEDGIRQIKQKIPRTYDWLYHYDREWLSLTPKKKTAQRPHGALVNWTQRDLQISQQIRLSARHLKENSTRPIRVTINSLAHSAGQREVIAKNLDKLPLTAQVLEEVTETCEAFALRRVQWLAECYICENVHPTRWQFVHRGNFHHPQARWKSVKNAVDDALRRLRADLV